LRGGFSGAQRHKPDRSRERSGGFHQLHQDDPSQMWCYRSKAAADGL
jgi:hypothetical protein